MARPAIVFDVNETLLDLQGLDPVFAELFGAAEAREAWFRQLLALSLTANSVGVYEDFGVLGGRALRMVGSLRGREIGDAEVARLSATIRALRPHPDVVPALDRLRAAGLRLATLTNSPPATVEAQLAEGGLRDRFERVLSVDPVRRYKPAPETYRYAADRLDLPIGAVVLVAAHGWDVYGAACAGARAAFVARPGQPLIPGVPAPEIVAPDLVAVAERLIAIIAS